MFIWFWIRESLTDLLLGKKKEIFRSLEPFEVFQELTELPKRRTSRAALTALLLHEDICKNTTLILKYRVVFRQRFGIRCIYSQELTWTVYDSCDRFESPKKLLFWSSYDENQEESTAKFLSAMRDYVNRRRIFASGLIPC